MYAFMTSPYKAYFFLERGFYTFTLFQPSTSVKFGWDRFDIFAAHVQSVGGEWWLTKSYLWRRRFAHILLSISTLLYTTLHTFFYLSLLYYMYTTLLTFSYLYCAAYTPDTQCLKGQFMKNTLQWWCSDCWFFYKTFSLYTAVLWIGWKDRLWKVSCDDDAPTSPTASASVARGDKT